MVSPKRWLLALALLVLLGGSAWGWTRWRSSRQLAEVERMGERLWADLQNSQIPREQRRERFDQLRTKVDALPPELREQYWQDQQQRMMAREQAELSRFFALSPAERTAELDKQIDRMVRWRTEREARRARGDGGPGEGRREEGGSASGGPGGPGGDGRREGGRPGGGRDGSPGGPGGPGGRGPGGGGDGGRSDGGRGGRGFSTDPQQINERRRERLDATTPQYRAQRDEYRRLMQERMTQRGISAPPWGRG